MDQNTTEWLQYRKTGIGASDVNIIMGVSEYKTPYQLWEDKLSTEIEEQKNTFITDKGHRLEPVARAQYEILTGIEAPPLLAEREDNPWMRASLDGFAKKENIVLEIKYTGNGAKWKTATEENRVPDCYWPQVQWQLFVTGARLNHYVSFNGEEIHMIEVEPDIEYIRGMVEKVTAFWNMVKTQKAPELSDRDYKNVRSKELKGLVQQYVQLKEELKPKLETLSEIEKAIKENENWTHPRMRLDDVKLIQSTRKGSVDYKKIVNELLPDVDTSKYVKKATTTRMIRV